MRGCSGSSPSPAASRATSRPRRPGSIHEGGELGYALAHAYGAAFDNPDLLVACVIGDGEAETGPLAAQLALEQVPRPGRATARCCRSCTSTATRSPTRPCWPASPTTSWTSCCGATATRPHFVAGDDPADGATRRWPRPSTTRSTRSPPSSEPRARGRAATRPPPALADDRAAHAQGLDRAEERRRHAGRGHLARPTRCRWPRSARQPRAPARSSRSGCAPTGPRSCSTPTGRLRPELAALAAGRRRGG